MAMQPFTLLQEMAFGKEAEQFDIIHSHLDFLGFPMGRRSATPVLTTLHGQLDLTELFPISKSLPRCPCARFPTPNVFHCPI